MNTSSQFDAWSAGRSYEQYMGRWSRRIAAEFVAWLAPPRDAAWAEIGCGTGALTANIVAGGAPGSVLAVDASPPFVAHARNEIGDPRVRFAAADARRLPVANRSIDVVASALVLNFVPEPAAALAEMRRVLRPDGLLSFYVWDYPGGGIGFISAFWRAAVALDPSAAALGEGVRFPGCTRDGLAALCRAATFPTPEIAAIEIETVFPDFEAFWQPFTLGAGPAPGYCASLSEDRRALLKARLAEALGSGGPIRLPARAWAVKARRPG